MAHRLEPDGPSAAPSPTPAPTPAPTPVSPSQRWAATRAAVATWIATRDLRLPSAAGLTWRFSAIGAALRGPALRDRLAPIGVATIVLVASILSAGPAVVGATGDVQGAGSGPRIGVAGLVGDTDTSNGPDPDVIDAFGANGHDLINDDAQIDEAGNPLQPLEGNVAAGPGGQYLDDGTLLKPMSVDTEVPDGSDQLRQYRVRSGDTLTGIAAKFDVSMMTIWWANKLKSKNDLHVGQILVIPPVTGTVIHVKEGDTLASLAAKSGVDKADIVSFNGLESETLVIGQTLIIPGGKGKGIATPKPKPPSRSTGSGGGGTVHSPSHYGGGAFAWPVPGGYISQYFHYGHYALDIANDYGSPIVASAAGTVIFAGWKNNGGGYAVWISHGSGLYTTYNHMSSIAVGRGQSVGRGQFIGRVGQSGNATGPHCHFEVWIGYPWQGGSRRVNPLIYL